jgi:Uma2 family endonuclease
MVTSPRLKAPWGEYAPWVGRMTVEQFEQFPGEEGWVFELHEGRLVVMPGPGAEHTDIQERFFLRLGLYIRSTGLGHLNGTSCYNLPLPNNTEELLCPDLSYIEPARRAAMPLHGSYLVGAPDLAIEIASPSETRRDMAAKVAIYLQAGVRLVWVAWPGPRTIDVWRPISPGQPVVTLQSSDTLDGLDVVPSFQCPVRDIFAP